MARGRKPTGWIRQRGDTFELMYRKSAVESFATLADAQGAQRDFAALMAGQAPDLAGPFVERWVLGREGSISQRGWLKECHILRGHLLAAPWADMPLRSVSPRVAQQWVNDVANTTAKQTLWTGPMHARVKTLRDTGEPLSAQRCRDIINLAARAFDAAIVAGKMAGARINGIAHGNPLRMVVLPPRLERDECVADDYADDDSDYDESDDAQHIVFLTTAEIDRLLACPLQPHVRLAYVLAIYTGLRRSELHGLQWRDIRLTGPRPELRVRRGYDARLKSKWSRRTVPLLRPALDALLAYRDLLGVTPIGRRHVFLKGDTASWQWQTNDASPGERFAYGFDWGWRDRWRRNAGIRPEVTFHALRHTCGSHLVQGTWTPRPLALDRVKLWLGHSSIGITERHYAALSKDCLHKDVGHTADRELAELHAELGGR